MNAQEWRDKAFLLAPQRTEPPVIEDEAAWLSEQCARLEAALRKYGRHSHDCAVCGTIVTDFGAQPVCTCGLDAALDERP